MRHKIYIALFFFMAGLTQSGNTVIIDEIIAKVNEDIITLSEFQEYLEPLARKLERENQGPDYAAKYEELKEQVLRNMIEDLLLKQQAEKADYQVDPKYVKETIDNIKKEYRFETDAQLEKALKEAGKTLSEYREEIKRQYQVMRLKNEKVDSKVSVLESEMREYYDTHKDDFRARGKAHIKQLVLPNDTIEAGASRRAAEEIHEQLKQGADFDTIVSEQSIGPAVEKGGDIGTFKEGELQKIFNDAIFKVSKSGEITELIETPQGFYIFKVEEYTPGGVQTFDTVKDSIEDMLLQKKAEVKLKAWLDDVYNSSFVQVKRERIFKSKTETLPDSQPENIAD